MSTTKTYLVHGRMNDGETFEFATNYITQAITYARGKRFLFSTDTITIVEYRGKDDRFKVGIALFTAERASDGLYCEGLLEGAVNR